MSVYYQDEWVTLYHGDCLELTDWLSADVLVTDPPYGIEYRPNKRHWNPAVRKTAARTAPAISGDTSVAVRDSALELWGNRPAIIFGSWREPRPKGVIRHRLIWHKAKKKPGVSPSPWFSVEEEIYIIGGGWTGGPKANVITTNEVREREPGLVGHPTPKPLGLMEALIQKAPGVIADPFAGAGATLIAAKHLGRHAIGVEIEERYCEITARRLAQDTLFGGVA